MSREQTAGGARTGDEGWTCWEIRHSAMLGLKYTLAARAELLPSLLPRAAAALSTALADADDDVRGVAFR